jgi:uncharacterized caspase-like protein
MAAVRAACLVFAAWVVLTAPPAGAFERYALVIGNSQYAHVERLPNAARDATAMVNALEALDFTVFEGIDLTAEDFARLIGAFEESAVQADTIVLYYAGHGFQIGGRHHLTPVDAVLRDRSRIDTETLVLEEVIARLHRPWRRTIAFIDACRNDPLPPGAGTGTVAGPPVGSGDGTFIAFATQPGTVSYDGAGTSSPFSQALLAHIGTAGLDLSGVMAQVRHDVSARTAGRQVPWHASSLRAEFVLNPAGD